MSVKGKRTGAWSPMTDEQKRSFAYGDLVDESIPEAKVRIAVLGIDDPDAFVRFLSPRVGLYRSRCEAKPPISEELAWAETTMDFIQETKIRLAHFPPDMGSAADLSHWTRHKEKLHVAIERLNAELAEVGTTILLAMRAVEPYGGKRGRKHSWARDSLLTDVAAWMENVGVQTDLAARISRKVLVALGIEAPRNPAMTIRQHKERRQQMHN